MRTIKFLLQKEFRQIFRDPAILRMILVAPMIQLIVLPMAADYEVKNIRIAVVDQDHSTYAHDLVESITSSGYFILADYNTNYKQSLTLVEDNEADLVLQIPPQFEQQLVRDQEAPVYMAVNAINGTKAIVGAAYMGRILMNFNNNIRSEWMHQPEFNPVPVISLTSSNWYNPLMSYKVFMVPGILVMLVTMIGSMMCALNIVREKEIGTIEQINVTPIGKVHFILGKLIPFWVLSMIVFTIGLTIARLVYGIVPLGNIGLLYGFLAVYLLAVLGLGLLISTFAATQQQAMSVSFFFIMIFNLMSGLFTPIESMPEWAQVIAHLNPVSYFIEVMRMVVLKGSGVSDIAYNLGIIALLALVFNTLAILNYRKNA
ncbi:MAG: ABC transporter permease [Flavobacteriales bacterium]|nr:ABC transporter permease [Flavobacteriales bacterium]MCB9447993.1 ABC transporter permease [Flavobacteriales bacterium]